MQGAARDRHIKHIRLAPETTLRFDQDTYLEPDFVFYEARLPIKELAPRSALPVVEISDSSLGYDLGRKAHLYAVNGVRELWVMDAVKLETHVHRDPGLDGYRFRQVFSPGEIVSPASCAELAVRLGSLQLV